MLFIIWLCVGLCAAACVRASVDGNDKPPPKAPSHCFKRIAGGERLIGYDVTRIVERSTVGECEEECNVYKCTHFSFGNLTGVNGTCELTTDREIARTQDNNFDLYQRTDECAEGKPTGYEKACYRRIITGKRLHERFIRHSLPCNSLQACQHQCSIEKHFACQGFNIRLDPARVGRGICELSSFATTHLDLNRDFVFDPEFSYYERDHDNGLPNCGHFNAVPNAIPAHNPEENSIGYQPPLSGGPYYGGDSYGPWSTGHGTVDHGPWGSRGYGSGFYESNNPSKGPAPSFRPDVPIQQGPYSGYGQGYGYATGWQGQGVQGNAKGFGPYFIPNGPHRPYGPDFGPSSQNHGYNGGSYSWGPGYPYQPGPQGPYPGSDYPGGGNRGVGPGPGTDIPGHVAGGRAPGFNDGKPYKSGGQQGSFPGYGFGYGYGYGYGHGYDYEGSHGGRGPVTPGGSSLQPGPYGQAGRPPSGQTKGPNYHWGKPIWPKYPTGDRRYDRPNRIPTYIIIDADAKGRVGVGRFNYQPYRPSVGYLPVGPSALSPPRPLPPPQPPRQPPPYSFHPEAPGKFGVSSNTIGREVCFRREHPGYKLNANTVRGMYETPTVLDCEAMCMSSPFKCTGYSFRYSSSGTGPNCLLTDHTSLNPETHLLPDRSCDVYFKMGTCMEFDRMGSAECFLKVATNRKLDPGKLVKMLSVSDMSECELACLSSAFFTCRSYSFRRGPPVIGEPVENCFLSDWPISALSHLDFVPAASHEIYERGSFGHGCELDAGPPHIGPRPPFTAYPNLPEIPHGKDPWGMAETWRHYTVNGWPCKAGTECQLNPEAGFWACEVEGGDRAQWDYCCRPKHSCGFSRGYHYPWCYVGEAGPEQWRPCSEFYYPEFDNRYPYSPVQGHNPHPDDSYGPPRDTRPWNFGQDKYGPPSFWPISYIHAEPPPNETYIWDPEEHVFYHYDEHYELHPPEHLQEPPADGPRIRFKPCGHRHPFPRAIVQKLDLKNISKAGNPEEELMKEEKPRAPKVEDEPALGFSPENRDKKKSPEFFPSVAPAAGNLTERDLNGTNVSFNKTKEVIKEVEKIIMESSTGAEPEKNESLKKVETKHPGFLSLSLLEKPEFWN